MSAYDAATGRRIWFKQAGPRINSTATVVNGIVYVGSADKKLYAFDGATGRGALHPGHRRRHRLLPRRREPRRHRARHLLRGQRPERLRRRRPPLGGQRHRSQRRRELLGEVVVQRLRRHARQPARRRHVVAAGIRQGQERPAAGDLRRLEPRRRGVRPRRPDRGAGVAVPGQPDRQVRRGRRRRPDRLGARQSTASPTASSTCRARRTSPTPSTCAPARRCGPSTSPPTRRASRATPGRPPR